MADQGLAGQAREEDGQEDDRQAVLAEEAHQLWISPMVIM
jgi:hypothetical protein